MRRMREDQQRMAMAKQQRMAMAGRGRGVSIMSRGVGTIRGVQVSTRGRGVLPSKLKLTSWKPVHRYLWPGASTIQMVDILSRIIYSGDLKSDSLKSRLFKDQISNVLFFKGSRNSLSNNYSANHLKTGHSKSGNFWLHFKCFLTKWWQFVQISNPIIDPIRNPDHLFTHLFLTIQNSDLSGF